MDQDSPKERARRIRKKRDQTELEYDLAQDLKRKERIIENQKKEQQHRNKYSDGAILFFSTLGISYVILFILRYLFMYFFGSALAWFGISLAYINPFLHATIWIMAILSVYRGRSVLDDIFNRFI